MQASRAPAHSAADSTAKTQKTWTEKTTEDTLVTKRIGLLPTFEVGMPRTLKSFMEFLDLKLKYEGETYDFEVDRVKVKPVNIRKNIKKDWDLFIDRTTHWHKFMRAFVQHAIYDGVYVLNHPSTFAAINKHASFVFLSRLGSKVPETVMIPQHTYIENEEYTADQLRIHPDMTPEKFEKQMQSWRHYRDKSLPEMFANHNVYFDFDAIPEEIGDFPFYLKPGQDGGGGSGVSRIENSAEFHEKYAEAEDRVMHAQKAVDFDDFVRCMGIGPQVWPMKFLPEEPLHRHYAEEAIKLTATERARIIGEVKIINAVFRWEYNSYEALLKDGNVHPIDYANACPDSAITSLHVHFPWVIKALVKWTVYCVVTNRQMRFDLNQAEFLQMRLEEKPDEAFDRALKLANEYFEEDRFNEFVDQHLSHLDEAFAEFHGKGLLDPILEAEIRISRFPDWEQAELIDEYKDKLARSVANGMS